MKKLSVLLLSALLILSAVSGLTACGNNGNNGGKEEEPTVVMTESYKTARTQFKAVTGIEVPALEKLEVQEYPYTEGTLGYCFDIIGGENLSIETFNVLKAFLDAKLSAWDIEGPSTDGEYTNVDYTSVAGDWIGLTWDATNKAVYLNANMSGVVIYDTFTEARAALAETYGITIPDYKNVSLKWNSFKKDGTEVTFGFSKDDFTESTSAEVEAVFTAKFGEPVERNNNNGYTDTRWADDKLTYGVSWDPNEKTIDINICSSAI